MSEEYGQEPKAKDEKGLFVKGNKLAANRGPNKVSTKVKESIVNFLENNVDAIQDSFDKLKPKEKLEFIGQILPYAAPKLSSVQVESETNITGGITIKWEEPNPNAGQGQSSTGDL